MNITITPEFQKALDLFEKTNDCYYLDGEAGTGKTTLINYWEATTEKTVVKLAPTGAAAIQCKGQTIHSFFHFPIGLIQTSGLRFSADFANMVGEIDTIILDEASMNRVDMIQGIDQMLRIHADHSQPFGGIQIILVGDLYQLAPIVGKDVAHFFDSLYATPYFFTLKDIAQYPFKYMKLTTPFRQKNMEFIEALNGIRKGIPTRDHLALINSRVTIPDHELTPMYLSSVNRRVDAINTQRLARVNNPGIVTKAEIIGSFDKKLYPAKEVLILKIGARITVLVNMLELGIVNGSMGEVISYDPTADSYFVKIDDLPGEYEINRYKWEIYKYTYENGNVTREILGSFEQFPLALGYARTIHKSQGSTYRQPVLLNFEGWFPPGLVYVGLSRATSLENIYLSQRIFEQNVQIDPRIGEFLDSQVNILHQD